MTKQERIHSKNNLESFKDKKYIQRRRLFWAIFLNLLIVLLEGITGLIGHSLALLANAAHDFADSVTIFIALFALVLSTRTPTRKLSFGFHRATILSAVINASLIVAVAMVVGYESISRFYHPSKPSGLIMLIVGATSGAINLTSALVVSPRKESRDINTNAAYVHLLLDALGALLVTLVGGIIFIKKGAFFLDPIASLVLSLASILAAFKLITSATNILMESSPKDIDIDKLVDRILEFKEVEDVHDIHLWSLSSDIRALTAHIVMKESSTIDTAQTLSSSIKNVLFSSFSIAHTTFEFESGNCREDEQPCI